MQIVRYGDAISLTATVVAIGFCFASVACGVATAAGVAIGAGIAAAQSYDKHKDLRRAGIQAAGSAVLGLISFGASYYLSGALGAAKAGAAAVDLNGAPVEFLGGMGVGAGIDSICDATDGPMC